LAAVEPAVCVETQAHEPAIVGEVVGGLARAGVVAQDAMAAQMREQDRLPIPHRSFGGAAIRTRDDLEFPGAQHRSPSICATIPFNIASIIWSTWNNRPIAVTNTDALTMLVRTSFSQRRFRLRVFNTLRAIRERHKTILWRVCLFNIVAPDA